MSLNLILTLQLTEKLCTDQQCDIYYMFYHFYAYIFLCPHGLSPPGTLSVGVVRTSVHLSEDQVKIFVQGRISRPSNGSKLIFHMRMYLYETAGIYKSHDIMTYISRSTDFGLARLSRLRFLSKVESQDLLMVASCYFT